LRAESSVDELRRLSQRIGAEETTDNKGNVMTRIERVLRTLAASSDPQALRIFLEYGFGRPVDRVEVDEVRPKTTLRLFFAHEFDKKFGDPAVRARILPGSRSNGEGTRRRLLPDADNPAAVPRHHEEAASHVCRRGLQQAGQGIWRHRDAVLSKLVD